MTIKPQPTLRGYSAWALERLVEARDISLAEGAAWILERWIDEQNDYLATRYRISIETFMESRGLKWVVGTAPGEEGKGEGTG